MLPDEQKSKYTRITSDCLGKISIVMELKAESSVVDLWEAVRTKNTPAIVFFWKSSGLPLYF